MLILVASLSSCKNTGLVKINNCPEWVKPSPKSFLLLPLDESVHKGVIDFLYDYQKEYDFNCDK